MLVPKEKTLYCKVCNEEFNFRISKDDYNLITIINQDKNELSPIIIKSPKRDRISKDDRKAFEEYFGKA
jgi:hypothetical protein